MAHTSDPAAGDISPDPFLEHTRELCSMDVHVLGGQFHFTSDSAALMNVVAMAYAGLPPHILPVTPPLFRIELRLSHGRDVVSPGEPPPVAMQAGAGFLCGVMDACNYAVLFPEQRRALIVASPDMLQKPYHLRYELIEFAVFTLATRALELAPLHGACVGRNGKAALVMGASGAGKSTLALHSLLRGLEFIAEDAVFVRPQSLLATGVANYLHVTPDALRFVEDDGFRRWIENAPTIRRRSGVTKYEVDLRTASGRLANKPLELATVVFASTRLAEDPRKLLHPVPTHDIPARLAAEQPYAVSQPGWETFVAEVSRRGAYELRRGRHPSDAVDALLSCLD